MASDSTAGGAPADMPVEPAGSNPPVERPSCSSVVEAAPGREGRACRTSTCAPSPRAQNVRRRAQQDVEKERKFGIERFAARRAVGRRQSRPRPVGAAGRCRPGRCSNVIVGVQATERELQSVLERHGVTRDRGARQAVQCRLPSGDDGSRGSLGADRHHRPGADPGLPARRPPAARRHGRRLQGRPAARCRRRSSNDD